MDIVQIEQKTIWDLFLLKHAPHVLFQSWEWGEVERRTRKKIWRVGISKISNNKFLISNYKQKVDDLLGISQVVKVVAKRGTFLHVRHGPVMSVYNIKHFTIWLDWIKALAKTEKASFIRISPLIDQTHAPFFFSLGFRSAPIHSMDAELVLVVDLSQSEEEILRKMRKTTRNLIRRAERDGVTVTKSADINRFIKLYEQTASRHGFVQHQAIREEFAVFSKSGMADLLFSHYHQDLLAGGIFLYYGNYAIYHHGASIPSKIPAAYLLQWEAIRAAKRRGIRYYNFWGIADTDRTNHPWWGLTQFKAGFGGNKQHYIHAMDLPIGLPYWIVCVVESIRKLVRGY
ncbi:peptidoglycan bridge formation glycyltransferase FemA/FemB family protein [Candidatus Roizmanbacteria bacterium]|nr:peptidoglycan bridge formation glycyltransferase FemA/FemB family protein [Candidatus Roizmanbacteria bacterium]